MAKTYPPFRVFMQTTQDISGDHSTYVGDAPFRGADGEGVVIPLDPVAWPEAAVEAAATAFCGTADWRERNAREQATLLAKCRAALAAFAAACGEVEHVD